MVHYYGKHRPDSLMIFGTRFSVDWFADLGSETAGLSDIENQKIQISKGVNPTLAVDTLLHEILHVVWYFADLRHKELEERAVTVMASGMNMVFSSNRELSIWIHEMHEG